MRRTAAVTALVCAGVLMAGAAEAKAPTQIGVTAEDVPSMSLNLSPSAVPKAPPGPANVELHNAGEDPHDMVMKRVGGHAKRRFDELGPDQSQELSLKLKEGASYKLWCTLPGHRSQGMEATLRVRRK